MLFDYIKNISKKSRGEAFEYKIRREEENGTIDGKIGIIAGL